ncbi:unnamed protein product [Staurois parvus]|uniref:Uncharacterized protein n=1 Tax=Staurois parvus TaxID=386267 RepID=A0ABN9BJ75_9NEOB|nr:unnamed protein product [Staurois parvus]
MPLPMGVMLAVQCSPQPQQCPSVQSQQHPSVLPVSVLQAASDHQCPQSVIISAASQCPSVLPVSADQWRLSVPISAALLVPISVAYQCPPVKETITCLQNVITETQKFFFSTFLVFFQLFSKK